MTELAWTTGSQGAEDFRIGVERRDVTGALWLPEKPAASTPLVLCGHGASGDRYQTPIPHLAARWLNERGFATLAIDGPVHGLRQVGPGGREALRDEMRRADFVDDMVQDWLLALEAIQQDRGVGLGPLAYFGLSMGTLFGIPLLAAAKRAGLDFKAATLGLAGTTGAVSILGDRLLADATLITHPLFYMMQLEDELFDRTGYLALFDALGSEDKRLHANTGRHPEIPAEEIAFAFEFLATRLEGEVPRDITNPIAE
jgi:pimeloyl-ACP methyl ester carboxylesterase